MFMGIFELAKSDAGFLCATSNLKLADCDDVRFIGSLAKQAYANL